jgi:hypothetical protein
MILSVNFTALRKRFGLGSPYVRLSFHGIGEILISVNPREVPAVTLLGETFNPLQSIRYDLLLKSINNTLGPWAQNSPDHCVSSSVSYIRDVSA